MEGDWVSQACFSLPKSMMAVPSHPPVLALGTASSRIYAITALGTAVRLVGV